MKRVHLHESRYYLSLDDFKRACEEQKRLKERCKQGIFVIEKRPHNRHWMKWDYDDHFPPKTGIATVFSAVLKYPVQGCKVDIRLRKGDTVYWQYRADDVDN